MKQWDKLSDKEKVGLIIAAMDQARLESHGGYWSQFVIDHGRVIHADYDAGKEYHAVTLSITPIKTWLAENEEDWREDAEEELKKENEYQKWRAAKTSGRPEYQSGRPSLPRSKTSGG